MNSFECPIVDSKSFAKFFNDYPCEIEVTHHDIANIEITTKFVKDRCTETTTIAGTRDYHFFEPNGNQMLVKKYSSSNEYILKKFIDF